MNVLELSSVTSGILLLFASASGCRQILGIDERTYDGGGDAGCDHDCLAGACEDGQCQPYVVASTPDSDVTDVAGIACDPGAGGEVYWVAYERARVYRASKTGSEADLRFVGPSGFLRDVVLDETSAFVANRDIRGQPKETAGYFRVPRGEGKAQQIASHLAGAAFMTLDGDDIYLVDSGGSPGLGKMPKNGGEIETLVEENIDSHIFIEDGWVYFGGEQPISRIRRDGTERTVLYDHALYSDVLGVHGGYIYWREYGLVQRAPIDGAGPARSLFPADPTPFQFVGGRVYFRSVHDIMVFDEALEAPTLDDAVVVVSGDFPDPLTNDGVSLIWAEHDTGMIWRLAL